MKTLSGQIVSPTDLAASQVERMFALMQATYGGCTLTKFVKDLHTKDYVLLLHDAANWLQGFTTAAVFDFMQGNQAVKILFSGDTVIAHEARGSLALMAEWWKLICTVRAQYSAIPLYWMLISKGWRTYKLCPLFFKRFYPTCREPTPSDIQLFMDALGRTRFGAQYQEGLVIPDEPDFLRTGTGDVPERKASDPDVRFFLAQNPAFHAGHELLCLCRLHPDNMTDLALRYFHKQFPC